MRLNSKGRPQIGKWWFSCNVSRDLLAMHDFVRVFRFVLIKLKQRPPEGAEYRREDYTGIIFQLRFVVPITIDRWR